MGHHTDKNTRGGRLRLARERLGLTQAEMAERLGIPSSTYSSKERAEGGSTSSRDMTVEQAKKYAKLLNVDHTWLLTGDGRAPAGLPADNLTSIKLDDGTPSLTPVVGWFGVPTGEGALYGFVAETLKAPCFATESTVAIEVKGRESIADGMVALYDDKRSALRKDATGLMVLGFPGNRIVLRRVVAEPGGGTRILPYGSGEQITEWSKVEWAAPVLAIMPRSI